MTETERNWIESLVAVQRDRIDRIEERRKFVESAIQHLDFLIRDSQKGIDATNGRVNRLSDEIEILRVSLKYETRGIGEIWRDVKNLKEMHKHENVFAGDPEGVKKRQQEQCVTPEVHDWAWACRQMLDGKCVRRPGFLKHALVNGTIQYDTLDDWADAFLIREDLTATDWQVAE